LLSNLARALTGCKLVALQALASRDAELAEQRARYAALTQQYDDTVHRGNLHKQVGAASLPAV
jgi:hypothetical protein